MTFHSKQYICGGHLKAYLSILTFLWNYPIIGLTIIVLFYPFLDSFREGWACHSIYTAMKEVLF